jgi:uncharacterized membrane protein YhaH (DUF805 family)
MQWYLAVLKKYAVFDGRAHRAEYWFFVLFNVLISIALMVIDVVVGTFGALGGLYGLAVIIPAIAVAVRRLHDIGRSGPWIFISFVPVAGPIILLIFMVTDSQPGENQYGPNPK